MTRHRYAREVDRARMHTLHSLRTEVLAPHASHGSRRKLRMTHTQFIGISAALARTSLSPSCFGPTRSSYILALLRRVFQDSEMWPCVPVSRPLGLARAYHVTVR